jgi:hypothetical protein
MRATGSLSVLPPAVLFRAAQRASTDLRLVMRQPSSGGVTVVVFRHGDPTMVFAPGDGRSLGELLLAAGAVDVATLDDLVQGRVHAAASLERLILQKTNVPLERVRQFLDFQARARLLEVLAWQDGFFDLQEYSGGGETAFRLELPSLDALMLRAQSRAQRLPGLLSALPAAPTNAVVRRRRGGAAPVDQVERDVLAALSEPLLITQIVARLLVDDDLILEAIVRLVDAKSVVVRPRLELAPSPHPDGRNDPRLGVVLREIVGRTRGPVPAGAVATLTVVVMSASAGDAARFGERLDGDPGEAAQTESAGGRTGLARRVLTFGDDARLCVLAIRPEALSRGALEGVLSRIDALVLLRAGDDPAELDRLQHLRAVARAGAGREPLTLGIELGGSFRSWGDYPEAMLGLGAWEQRPSTWLAERLVEGLRAGLNARE